MMAWKRVTITSLLLLVVIIIEFSLLTSFRLLALPYYAGEFCDLSSGDSTLCVTQLTLELLYQTQWRLLCFLIYAFTAMLIIWLAYRRVRYPVFINTIAIAVIAFVVLSLAIDTSQIDVIIMEPIGTFSGALLMGWLLQRAKKSK
jgi:hypothetical protein